MGANHSILCSIALSPALSILTYYPFVKVLAANDREGSTEQNQLELPQHVSPDKELREVSQRRWLC